MKHLEYKFELRATIEKQQAAMREALEKMETGLDLLRHVSISDESSDLRGARNVIRNAIDDLTAALLDDVCKPTAGD